MLFKKYIYKVLSNIVSMILSFIIAFFLPNVLGPNNFGKFDYLNSFNDNLKLFFDFNTSTSFYIEISKNNKNHPFFKYYVLHIITVLFLLILFLILLLNNYLYNKIFININYFLVAEALFWGYFVWISDLTRKIHDAIGNTTNSELHYISSKILLSIFFFTFIYFNILNLFNIVLINLIVSILLCFYQIYTLHNFYSKSDFLKIIDSNFIIAFKHIYSFAKPIFFYTLVIFFVSFLDRYLLLKNNNFDEQAFFGIAFRLSSISFFLITALTQLLMREFVIMENNFGKMHQIFYRKIFYLYTLISICSISTSFFSKEIIQFIYGVKYLKSAEIFTIISLYPLHQLFGQIIGAHFMTKNKTKLYSKIMILTSCLGIFVTYILVSNNFNLRLGGLGLSIKTIAFQFISTNILYYFICKEYKINFTSKMILQILIPFILFLFLLVVNLTFKNLFQSKFSFIYISFIYFVISLLITFFIINKIDNLKKTHTIV